MVHRSLYQMSWNISVKKYFGDTVTEEMLVSFYGMEAKPVEPGSNETRIVKRSKDELDRIRSLHVIESMNKTLTESRHTGYLKANTVNLTDFFTKTSPGYWVSYCFFGNYDCSGDFQLYYTIHGICLRIDPNEFDKYSSSER